MEWGRQKTREHFPAPSLRIEKQQAIEELDFVGGAYAAIEIFEIGAAAERDMLAVIDVLAVGQHVGGGPATQEGTRLEKANAAPGANGSTVVPRL